MNPERMTILNMLAEGKIYHDSSAIMDRAWAEMPLSPERFRAHVPEKMRIVAFIEEVRHADD